MTSQEKKEMKNKIGWVLVPDTISNISLYDAAKRCLDGFSNYGKIKKEDYRGQGIKILRNVIAKIDKSGKPSI